MPRPTKLTDDVQHKIVAAIRAGNCADAAAHSGGISEATYYNWLARGGAELAHREEGGRPRRREQPYVEFRDAIARASATAEVHAVAILRKAMSDDWRAAAWYLERRHPERWRRRESHEVEHHGSETRKPVQSVSAVSDPPWSRRRPMTSSAPFAMLAGLVVTRDPGRDCPNLRARPAGLRVRALRQSASRGTPPPLVALPTAWC
jgi:hypothetical protein